MLLHSIFLVLALVCFLIDFVAVPVPRVRLISLGLFFWVLAVLIVRV